MVEATIRYILTGNVGQAKALLKILTDKEYKEVIDRVKEFPGLADYWIKLNGEVK